MQDKFSSHNDHLELIYLFLDGEADNVQQLLLFDALANNPELQTKMQEAAQINKSLGASQASGPPTEIKQQVLSVASVPPTLALTDEEEEKPLRTPVGSLPFYRTSTGIISIAIVTAFLASVTTALLMGNLFGTTALETAVDGRSVDDDNALTQQGSVTSGPLLPGHDFVSETANISSEQNPVLAGEAISTIVAHSDQVTSPGLIAEDEPLARNAFGEGITPAGMLAGSIPSAQLNDRSDAATFFNADLLDVDTPEFNDISEPSPYSISIRGISDLFMEDEITNGVQPDHSWNNISAAINYTVDDHHSIGIEAGRESMEYVTQQRVGATIEPVEHYVMQWVGGAYQYSFSQAPLLAGTQPYMRIIAGGAAEGAVLKSIAGIRYDTQSALAMSLGLEGTMLLYRVEDNILSSKKFALTYGLSWRF